MNSREIIFSNYEKPYHRGLIEKKDYIKIKVNNNACIDEIELMLKIDNGIIKDIVFDGEACMIVIASTSILIKELIGKTVDEGKILLDNYEKMINQDKCSEKILGDLIVFDEIHKQPNRKICALLAAEGLKKVLK